MKVDCLGLEQGTRGLSKVKDLIDDLVAKVLALHWELTTIDLLIRVRHVEGSTEEQMIVGGVISDVQDFIIEQVVAICTILCQFVGEGLSEKGQEIYFSTLHSARTRWKHNTALTEARTKQVSLLQRINDP